MFNVLQSDDLILKLTDIALAPSVTEYHLRNKAFLEKFEPHRDEEFFTEGYQFNLLKQEMKQASKKESLRYYIVAKNDHQKIIGMIGLNNIVFGCFCSCFLGYKLDLSVLNKGYMTQAVSTVVKLAFDELDLHRIEANVMTHNKASFRVLEKCGFENEGLSKRYLKINGVWEDHIHMVKLNEQV